MSIVSAKISALKPEVDALETRVRSCQIKLADLRESNTALLEKIVKMQVVGSFPTDVTSFHSSWPINTYMLILNSLKLHYQNIQDQIGRFQIDGPQNNKYSLLASLNSIKARNQELIDNKNSLLEEITQLEEDCIKEKQELRQFLA